MGRQTVPSGERVELFGEIDSGTQWSLEASGAPITLNTSRNTADDGPRLLDGDVAIVTQPSGTSLWAYGDGGSDATVRASRTTGEEFSVNYMIRADMTISGNVDSDVTDRQGRNLGKLRLMTDDGALVTSANPLPVGVDDVTLTASDVGLVDSNGQAIDPATSGEDPREVATWSAGPVPATPNPSAVATGSVTGDGSFGSETIPDGFAMAIKADPANAGTAYVDGFPLEAQETVTLAVPNSNVPALSFDDQADSLHFIVEGA